MQSVPFVDLKAQYQTIKSGIDNAIETVIAETSFIGGHHVESFEKAFAAEAGAAHCIACANGTDSIFIILKMLGITAGDEVIVPALTWISTSETVGLTGATPVFADVNAARFTLDLADVAAKITPRTKAIIAVHLYGQMCNMDALTSLCTSNNLYLIEDCAQSHFSKWNGRLAGSYGIAASFSFYPGKNLGAYGDAGCITTNDAALAEKCRMFGRHGALKKHQHHMEGINSRLDGLQAAILNVKLPHIHNWNNSRLQHGLRYNGLLAGIPQIILPEIAAEALHTFHLYVIRAQKRNELAAFLKEKGIETAVHYPTALPFLPAYASFGHTTDQFPVSYQLTQEILSLPLFPEMTAEQQDRVVEAVRSFYA